jgi:hypothetical protein
VSAVAVTQSGSLSVNQACYVVTGTRPDIAITGRGYTPGDSVLVSDSLGGIDTRTTADPTGQIAVTVTAPVPLLSQPGETPDTISAEDFTGAGPEIKGTTTTELTILAVGNSGAEQRPHLQAFTEKTTWSFSGFPVARTVWGHYTHDGEATTRQSFGRPTGPCGLLTVRKRLYPVTPHHTTYTLQVDDSRTYSSRTSPALRLKLSLTLF